MNAVKRSFSDELEPLVYWDSSFAIARVEESDSWHDKCVSFAARMQKAGVVPATSELVYNELAFHIIKGRLIEEARQTGQHWTYVKRECPEVISSIMPRVESLWKELEKLSISLPLTEDVRSKASHLMREYTLLPTDAYHIAVAFDADVNAFVSLDEDFIKVDDIVVYTCVS